ncbi:cytochrome P450 [Streptomyces hydrogenans]|uniref:cytochrome P450 n=1 Tax=Streptomyces hydrogenans TaxID=1873719 RepID=UPI0033D665B9
MPQTTVPDHRGRAERPEEPGRPDPADRAGDGAGEPPRFPLPNTTPWRPSPGFAALREERPLCPVRLPTGSDAVLVTGYADNRALLADERFSRAAAARAGAPRARRIPLDATSLTTLDGAEHARLRSAVARAFTHRRVKALAPVVRAEADRQAAGLARAGRPADLVAGFTRPFSLGVIGGLLGVSVPDLPAFRAMTEAYLSVDGHTPEEMLRAVAGLKELLGEVVARRRAEPTDDVLGVLAADRSAAALSDAEIVTFGTTLLVAGYETTAALIANAAVALFTHPEQWAAVRAAGGLSPRAVEELLRYTAISVGGGTLRVTVEDVELPGGTVPAGTAVQPATTAANHDPRVFEDPDVLDLEREHNPHLAFGHGVHYCLGANLARLELTAAFEALLARFPGLLPAEPPERIRWEERKMIRGPLALPVTW